MDNKTIDAQLHEFKEHRDRMERWKEENPEEPDSSVVPDEESFAEIFDLRPGDKVEIWWTDDSRRHGVAFGPIRFEDVQDEDDFTIRITRQTLKF